MGGAFSHFSIRRNEFQSISSHTYTYVFLCLSEPLESALSPFTSYSLSRLLEIDPLIERKSNRAEIPSWKDYRRKMYQVVTTEMLAERDPPKGSGHELFSELMILFPWVNRSRL